MKIYVDEFPRNCAFCPLCNADYKGELYCKQLDAMLKEDNFITDYKERKKNCPLKLISKIKNNK